MTIKFNLATINILLLTIKCNLYTIYVLFQLLEGYRWKLFTYRSGIVWSKLLDAVILRHRTVTSLVMNYG